ncbi:hypothetical protein CR513_08379, partial [Mucuna pruriens]
MKEEIKAIKKNDTLELSNLSKCHETIGVKWVFKIKKNARGEIKRYKARLVVKGYKQQYEIDYDEVFAPVARMETIRLLISIAAQMGWRIFQLDVKSAFLNDYLEENVYIEQPMSFAIKGQEKKVLKLKKVLPPKKLELNFEEQLAMNIKRVGVLVCSTLPLLSCFMELFLAAISSQPHFNAEENKLNKKKEDVSITANKILVMNWLVAAATSGVEIQNQVRVEENQRRKVVKCDSNIDILNYE